MPDLHGDFDHGVEILAHAKLIDVRYLDDTSHPVWIGGTTSLVQTGDIVDRGDRGKELYILFQRLQKEAEAAGGQVINLLGNHESMNLENDLRYVSAGDFEDFGGRDERAQAWSEHGWLGRWVRAFPAVAKVDNVLFSHAGLPLDFLEGDHTLEDINAGIRRAVLPHASGGDERLLGNDGPLWTRFYAQNNPEKVCSSLEKVLDRTATQRMVVGHTIQRSRKGYRVRSACNGRLLLGDTAVSSAYRGEPSYIEHDGLGGAVAVYPRTGEREALPLGAAAFDPVPRLSDIHETL